MFRFLKRLHVCAFLFKKCEIGRDFFHKTKSILIEKDNFSFTKMKTNFVCIKPIIQVFQVIINLFVHLFDGVTEI